MGQPASQGATRSMQLKQCGSAAPRRGIVCRLEPRAGQGGPASHNAHHLFNSISTSARDGAAPHKSHVALRTVFSAIECRLERSARGGPQQQGEGPLSITSDEFQRPCRPPRRGRWTVPKRGRTDGQKGFRPLSACFQVLRHAGMPVPRAEHTRTRDSAAAQVHFCCYQEHEGMLPGV